MEAPDASFAHGYVFGCRVRGGGSSEVLKGLLCVGLSFGGGGGGSRFGF